MSRTPQWVVAGCTTSLAIILAGQALAGESPQDAETSGQSATVAALERVRELAAACAHLEAAGALELARQAREEANQLLQQEHARIAREQAMLAELSDALVPPQFIIQALLIEAPDLPLERLANTVRELGGRQLPHDVRETSENAFAASLPGDTAGADLLRALESSAAGVTVLSRPQVRTLEDRPAQVQVGQARPVVEGVTLRDDGTAASIIAEATTGVMLAVTPHRTADGQTTLEAQVERSWFEETETTLHIDPASGAATTAPVKSSFSACTEMQSEPGHVVLLAVRPDSRPSAAREARVTLIVVLHSRQVQENR